MADLKHSICFILVLSYNYYKGPARKLLRSLNSKFKAKYTLSLSSAPFGPLDYYFKSQPLKYSPQYHQKDENQLLKVMDRSLEITGLPDLYYFGQVAMIEFKTNPELLQISCIKIGGRNEFRGNHFITKEKPVEHIQEALKFLKDVKAVIEIQMESEDQEPCMHQANRIFEDIELHEQSCLKLYGCGLPLRIKISKGLRNVWIWNFSDILGSVMEMLTTFKRLDTLTLEQNKVS